MLPDVIIALIHEFARPWVEDHFALWQPIKEQRNGNYGWLPQPNDDDLIGLPGW